MAILGADYSGSRPSPAELAAAGVTWVSRYLSHSAWKNLTRAEAEALSAAGISIVSNWETTTTRAEAGYAAGQQDARDALAQATACGMPPGRPIYFSVDADVSPSSVTPYFQGVNSVLNKVRTGVYGSTAVCRALLADGLVAWTWRTMSTSWSGGAGSPGEFNIVQTGGTIINSDVDVNHAQTSDFGQWTIGGTAVPVADITPVRKEDDVSVGTSFPAVVGAKGAIELAVGQCDNFSVGVDSWVVGLRVAEWQNDGGVLVHGQDKTDQKPVVEASCNLHRQVTTKFADPTKTCHLNFEVVYVRDLQGNDISLKAASAQFPEIVSVQASHS